MMGARKARHFPTETQEVNMQSQCVIALYFPDLCPIALRNQASSDMKGLESGRVSSSRMAERTWNHVVNASPFRLAKRFGTEASPVLCKTLLFMGGKIYSSGSLPSVPWEGPSIEDFSIVGEGLAPRLT